ncbi:MAG TPA: hypothetical protein VF669_01440 [Tepidisphaeraceae bacterium]|jgi:hypothetical protein
MNGIFKCALAAIALLVCSCTNHKINEQSRQWLNSVETIEYQKPDGRCFSATPNQIEPWNVYSLGRSDPYWSVKARDNAQKLNVRDLEYKTHDGSTWLARLIVHSTGKDSGPAITFGFSRPGVGGADRKVTEGATLQYINWQGEKCEATPEVRKKGNGQWQVLFRERTSASSTSRTATAAPRTSSSQ